MKLIDMFRMSLSSLWKRKVRTVLTVLGVVIGTASIVVMISLGLGLKRASLAEIEQYGGLKTIHVYEKDGYDEDTGSGSKKNTVAEHLSDKVVEEISSLEHVEQAYPVLTSEVLIFAGRYTCHSVLTGIPVENMEALGLELSAGDIPDSGEMLPELIFGNAVIAEFMNDKTSEGYWYNGKLPDIDLMTDNLTYIFDTDKYYDFLWGGQDENGNPVPIPKKYMLKTAGVVAGDVEDYNNNAYTIYCDIEPLKKLLKKEFRGKSIPGQPLTVSGKPLKEVYYNSVEVIADDMNNVKDLQNAISRMGYSAESNAEWVESMQGEFKYIQLALGGIGAVSLLVAAIGIANTMMMSIYERTKEIGIMKVLGCDLRNIQAMFLMEAGYIGLLGGVIGAALSWGVSFAINHFISAAGMGMDIGSSSQISYIPAWLILLSVGFAVAVGMVAGFFPSLRAMRLSPLAAIRSE